MKKFGLLTIALVLFGAALVPVSLASRDAYHNYLYQKHGTQDKLDYKSFDYGHKDGRGVNPSRNLRYKQGAKRNAFARRDYSNASYPRRHSTDRIQPWTARSKRNAVEFKSIPENKHSFVRYANESFALSMPKGWRPTAIGHSYRFINQQGDLLVTLKRFKKCSNVSFFACSVAYSLDENHKNPAERILSTSRVVRQSHFQNALSDSTLQTETYTESFSGRVGDNEVYITRYFVHAPDGSVYLIDARTPLSRGRSYLSTIKKIFDSFTLLVE